MTHENMSGSAYLAIPYGDNGVLDSVAIADLDEAGNIAKIITGGVSHRTVLAAAAIIDGFQKNAIWPKGAAGADLAVAWYLNREPYMRDKIAILDREFEDSWLDWLFHRNAERILMCIPDASENEKDELYRNAFGYLFAKAIEIEYIRFIDSDNAFCIYDPVDAWDGTLHTSLNSEKQTALEYEHARGRTYYDLYKYSYFYEMENVFFPYDWCIEEEALTAFVRVQRIGQAYARELVNW